MPVAWFLLLLGFAFSVNLLSLVVMFTALPTIHSFSQPLFIFTTQPETQSIFTISVSDKHLSI